MFGVLVKYTDIQYIPGQQANPHQLPDNVDITILLAHSPKLFSTTHVHFSSTEPRMQ